jgi:hypothetical protein
VQHRDHRSDRNSIYRPKVFVDFVRRQDKHLLMSCICHLKEYKLDEREIFIENDTIAEGKTERCVAIYVRYALIKKYTDQVVSLPAPLIRVSGDAIELTFCILFAIYLHYRLLVPIRLD